MTTVALAKILKANRRTIQRWCALLGYEREGRDYLLTPDQVKEITTHVKPGPGRPRKADKA
jgi:hypothetical protein